MWVKIKRKKLNKLLDELEDARLCVQRIATRLDAKEMDEHGNIVAYKWDKAIDDMRKYIELSGIPPGSMPYFKAMENDKGEITLPWEVKKRA